MIKWEIPNAKRQRLDQVGSLRNLEKLLLSRNDLHRIPIEVPETPTPEPEAVTSHPQTSSRPGTEPGTLLVCIGAQKLTTKPN